MAFFYWQLPQIDNINEFDGFQSEINNVVFSAIMINNLLGVI